MIVVSDTTAITTLLKCGEERLLQQLFGTVIIPQAVGHELLRFHPRLPDFVSVCQVETPPRRSNNSATIPVALINAEYPDATPSYIPESQWPAYARRQIEWLVNAGIARNQSEMYFSEKPKR